MSSMTWCGTQKDYRDAVHADAAKSKRIREKLGTPAKHKLAIQREQLPGWFAAVRALPNPVISVFGSRRKISDARAPA